MARTNKSRILVWCSLACLVLFVLTNVSLYQTAIQGVREIRKLASPDCQKLHFSREPLPVTLLASFPGSGNTWLRHLLQQATGIYTGSVYYDRRLAETGFPGEGVRNGSVVVVKAHEKRKAKKTVPFADRCVLLIRDPAAAILAEFQRKISRSHTAWVPPMYFLLQRGWQKYQDHAMKRWEKTYLKWAKFPGPLLVVQYESLVRDLESELTRILTFIEVGFRKKDLMCAIENSEGLHKRPKWPIDFDPYTSEMKWKLDQLRKKILSRLEQ